MDSNQAHQLDRWTDGSTHSRRCLSVWLVSLCLLGLLLPGCAWPRLNLRGNSDWGRRRPKCELENPTQTELVNYLNERIANTPRWRCNDVRISARGALGFPVSLSAMMAVEERRNFRLVAHAPGGGTEVDLGSNEERFWFYAKQSDRPGIYTCRHELLDEAQRQMPLPLNPDWFTEVLGVVPFENSEVTMKAHDKNQTMVYLIRDRKGAEGTKPMELVSLIDCCQGLIIEQQLRESNGPVIAWARMSQFQKHPDSVVRIPHRVDLSWPQADMGLTLTMKRIDIVQSPFGSELFDMPQIANIPVHEYSGTLVKNTPHAPAIERRGEAEYNDESEEFVESTGRSKSSSQDALDEEEEQIEDELPRDRRQRFSPTNGERLNRRNQDDQNPFE